MQDLLFVVLGIIRESWPIEIEYSEERVIVEDMDRWAMWCSVAILVESRPNKHRREERTPGSHVGRDS
jgi:hypothetical protein